MSQPTRHISPDTPVSDAEIRQIQDDLDELVSTYDVVMVAVVFRASDKQAFNGTTLNSRNLCDDPESCEVCGKRTHACKLANYMAASGLLNDEAQRLLLEGHGA